MTDATSKQDPLADELEPIDRIEQELADPNAADADAATDLVAGVWWWVLVRGLLAIAFGVVALFISPASAVLAIVLVFGAYAIVDGIVEITHGVALRGRSASWGWLIFAGVVSIVAGLLAVVLPLFAAVIGAILTLWMVVAYNLVHGIMVIGVAVKSERGRGWGIAAGVVSVLFAIVLGVLLLVTPATAIVALLFAIGIYAVVFGVTLVVTSISARVTRGPKAVVSADALR